ncbi:hypothetical protein BGX38DRAFT_1195538 [Terfezia claveryi]|nr:hypothetical protein BGX38DRAFT_1195538 [Terfezia claveryi]
MPFSLWSHGPHSLIAATQVMQILTFTAQVYSTNSGCRSAPAMLCGVCLMLPRSVHKTGSYTHWLQSPAMTCVNYRTYYT